MAAHQEGAGSSAGRLVIRNIGLLLSGDIDRPVLDADAILVEDGVIRAVGKAAAIEFGSLDREIDAQGCVVTPGLIDNHVHTVAGD